MALTILYRTPRARVSHAFVRGGVRRMLSALGVEGRDVCVVLTDDADIRELNKAYRHRDRATNVLAFPLGGDGGESGRLWGDIVVSVDTAAREARRARCSPGRRILHLVAHGLLHLCGYDHERSRAEAAEMEHMEHWLLEASGRRR